MGTLYWSVEYGKVLLAYLLLMFVYPSVLFRSYLKGKGLVFWFCFCVSSQTVLLSTVILLLGLFHLLNVWVCRILFYGSLIWSVSRSVHLKVSPRYLICKVQNRTYGGKLLLLRFQEAVSGTLRKLAGFIRAAVKGRVIEFAALAVIVIYGVIYFSYGAFHEHYYGFGDTYVHHSWIYGLMQGQSFSHGIYPEGMHAVVYAMYALFGIRVYNVLLYLQSIHSAVFLLSAYALIRELFPWRCSGLLVLTVFLTMRVTCIDEVFSMSRLQWTLPQEFALYTVFTIPLFLVRYLKHAGPVMRRGKQSRMFWSDDLLMFALGIAVSFSVHFYATIMAIFSCAGVAMILCRRLFHWRRFVPVAASAILAVLVSAVPMGVGLAEGIPLQGSLNWALGVMEGTYDESGSVVDTTEPTAPANETTAFETVAPEVPQETYQPVAQPSQGEKGQNKIGAVWNRLTNAIKEMAGRREYYYGIDGMILLGLCALYWLGCLLWHVLGWVLRKKFHVRSFPTELLDGYATVATICVVFMVMLSNDSFGIPPLVAGSRLLAVKNVFLVALLAVPLDLAGVLLASFCGTWVMQCMGAVGAAAVLAVIVSSGQYHGYLYYEASRFPAAVEVSNSIIDTFPKDQFTIVSTTDEIYQIIEHGFHEEYLTFLENYKKDNYYLPTPYVFFFVEKHPLQYGHSHFFTGPEWLALPRYQNNWENSLCPQMLTGVISDDKADREIVIKGTKLSLGYTLLFNRETVESAAARYIRILRNQYPNNISVYYEDEDFVCYCLKQNPDRLIQFRYPAAEESK